MSNVKNTKTYQAIQRRLAIFDEEVKRFTEEGFGDITPTMTVIRTMYAQVAKAKYDELNEILHIMLMNDDISAPADVLNPQLKRAITEMRAAVKEEGPEAAAKMPAAKMRERVLRIAGELDRAEPAILDEVKAMIDADAVVDAARAQRAAEAAVAPRVSFDFLAHLERQRSFSAQTFGPGMRTAGVADHIRKELREIEAEPTSLEEWRILLVAEGVEA